MRNIPEKEHRKIRSYLNHVWWGVSPGTLKEWQSRYKAEGEAGLEPKPKHRSKQEVPEAIKEKIVEIKQKEPKFGVRRIADYLARHKFCKISDEAVRHILKTDERVAGLMNPAHEAKGDNKDPKIRRFERSKPRQLYQMDIMTWMLKGLYRVYLIGCLDDYSRYVVSWGLFRRQSSEHAIDVLRAGIERYGSPEEVLTDNGRQFYTWRGMEEKEKILREVWSGKKNVRQACQEAGISRVTYYEWEKAALAGMKDGLEEKKPGRKKNEELKTEEELREKICQTSQALKETEKRISKLEREKLQTDTDLYIARRVIEWRIEDGTLDIKKTAI